MQSINRDEHGRFVPVVRPKRWNAASVNRSRDRSDRIARARAEGKKRLTTTQWISELEYRDVAALEASGIPVPKSAVCGTTSVCCHGGSSMNAKRRMPKRVALYVRTSTANGQTTRNQERELQAVAKRHGWEVMAVYRDQGISGAKGRDKRPGLDRLMQAVARREVDMVAAWSVDRLGRSLTDLLGVLQDLHAKGVDLYLHQQGLDTSTPSGRAMYQMLGVFAEFERAIIRERVMAGLARAKAEGTRLGRPATVADNAAKVRTIRAARAAGKSIRAIAREYGVGIGTVSRLTA